MVPVAEARDVRGGGNSETYLKPLQNLGPNNYVQALTKTNIAKLEIGKGFISETCFDFILSPLGITDTSKLDSYLKSIQDSTVLDGPSSGVRMGYLYSNADNPHATLIAFGSRTVGGSMTRGTTAMAELNGARVWINSPLINSPDMTSERLRATLMHEALHNFTGMTDADLQRKLGLTESADTSNISALIMGICTGK